MEHEKKLEIYEIGFRDYRLCHDLYLPAELVVDSIEKLTKAGIKKVEIGASVNYNKPKFKHIRNTYEILALLRKRKVPGIFSIYTGPSLANYPKNKIKELLETKVLKEYPGMPDEISVSISASEDRNREIYKMHGNVVLDRVTELIKLAKKDNIPVRGYISAAFGYKNGNDVPIATTIGLCQLMFELGCYQVILGDTRGQADPSQFKKKWNMMKSKLPVEKLAMHFHEHAYMQWQTDIMQAICDNISCFDTSILDKPEPHNKTDSQDTKTIDKNIPPNVSTEKIISYVKQLNEFPQGAKLILGADSFTTGLDYKLIHEAGEEIRKQAFKYKTLDTRATDYGSQSGYRKPF